MRTIDVKHLDREHLPEYCGDRTVRLLQQGEQLCTRFEQVPTEATRLDLQAQRAAENGHELLKGLTV